MRTVVTNAMTKKELVLVITAEETVNFVAEVFVGAGKAVIVEALDVLEVGAAVANVPVTVLLIVVVVVVVVGILGVAVVADTVMFITPAVVTWAVVVVVGMAGVDAVVIVETAAEVFFV